MIIRYLVLLVISIELILNAKDSQLELGVGIGSVRYPDYIGSKSYRTMTIAFPYIRYSGDYFNIDKNGINKHLFNIKDLTLDLSVSGSLSSNSQNNDAREGMPDLNFTFEVGPKLSYRFYNSKHLEMSFDLALRGVFETDLKMLDTQGLVGTTELKFEFYFDELEVTFRSGLRFANDRYNNYFYGVDKKYEMATRKEYSAKSGYSGYKNKLGFTYRSGSWWYGGFGSYHTIDGAIYEKSPLVETNQAFFVGASISYIFYTD